MLDDKLFLIVFSSGDLGKTLRLTDSFLGKGKAEPDVLNIQMTTVTFHWKIQVPLVPKRSFRLLLKFTKVHYMNTARNWSSSFLSTLHGCFPVIRPTWVYLELLNSQTSRRIYYFEES